MSQVDLDTVGVHPKAKLSALIPRLSCRRCPNAPFAKLKGFTQAEERPRNRSQEEFQRQYDEEKKGGR